MTSAIPSTAPRRLIVAIHDVAPKHEVAVDRLYSLLERHVGARVAMLVVPNFWSESPIVRGSPFAHRLRRWADHGVEMFLHGFTHRDDSVHKAALARFKAKHMTAREGEFLGLDAAEAMRRVVDGRKLVEDVIGRPVTGFVAPAWLYGEHALATLKSLDIGVLEDHWKVWSAGSGAVLARSPVITWATRTNARRLSSLAVASFARTLPTPRIMRVAVHPGDMTNASVVRSIDTTISALRIDHVVSSYTDLVSDAGRATRQ